MGWGRARPLRPHLRHGHQTPQVTLASDWSVGRRLTSDWSEKEIPVSKSSFSASPQTQQTSSCWFREALSQSIGAMKIISFLKPPKKLSKSKLYPEQVRVGRRQPLPRQPGAGHRRDQRHALIGGDQPRSGEYRPLISQLVMNTSLL